MRCRSSSIHQGRGPRAGPGRGGCGAVRLWGRGRWHLAATAILHTGVAMSTRRPTRPTSASKRRNMQFFALRSSSFGAPSGGWAQGAECDWLCPTLATARRRPPHLLGARGRRASGCPPLVRALRIGRASTSPEQPKPSTPTGGVRLRRRLDLIIAAVRGLYTAIRSTPMALVCRAATNPPARAARAAARAAALRGLSPLSCSRRADGVRLVLQVAASTSVVYQKLIKHHD